MAENSLSQKLGGTDAIAAVAGALVGCLQADARPGRFWAHRGADGVRREKQLLIDFSCANAGGPLLYTGREMKATHAGMRIDEADWAVFGKHARDTLDSFSVPAAERDAVIGFLQSLEADIVEA